jgi:hypothetical protein
MLRLCLFGIIGFRFTYKLYGASHTSLLCIYTVPLKGLIFVLNQNFGMFVAGSRLFFFCDLLKFPFLHSLSAIASVVDTESAQIRKSVSR